MNRLSRIHIGKIRRDHYEPMTVPKMLEIYGPYVDMLEWLRERQCKIEFEHWLEIDTDQYVDSIFALMDDATYFEYRLVWK